VSPVNPATSACVTNKPTMVATSDRGISVIVFSTGRKALNVAAT